MIRVFAVVATFVALNTGGFLAYRALQPQHTVTTAPSASAETISRPPAPIQPKPSQNAPADAQEAPQTHSPKSIVSEPTTPIEEEQAEETTTSAPSTTSSTRRVRRQPSSTSNKPKQVESQPSEKTKSPTQNSVMEMDDNPYKRGE